ATVGLAATTSAAQLGPLTPPAGPVNDTNPDLEDLEDKMQELLDKLTGELVPLPAVPGDATAVHVITQPGEYVLTGDLVVPPGMDGIRVESDCVKIKLNGHAIVDPANAADTAIRLLLGNPIVLPNPFGVEVEDGTIKGFQRGVDADDEWERVRLEHMKFIEQLQEAARVIGEGSEINDCEIFDSGGNGVTGGNGLKITDTDIVRPGGDGVQSFDDLVAEALRVLEAGDNAVDTGDGGEINDSEFSDAVNEAIKALNDFTAKNTHVTGAGGAGIQSGLGAELEGVLVEGCAFGVLVGPDSNASNTTVRNILSGAAFQAGPNTTATDCYAQAAEAGYKFGDAARVINTRAFDCVEVGIETGADSTVSDCDVKFINGTIAVGIRVFDNSAITNSTVTGVPNGPAIETAGPNSRVVSNTTLNSAVGVQMSANSFYFRNQAYANGANFVLDPFAAFGPIVGINGVGDISALGITQHPQANFQD
ncbi:MAG: hypothetical protein AAGK04_14180, partial [Planctomycetota bacterium]